MKVSYKIVLVFLSFFVLTASKGEDFEHEREHIHTIHHHHVQKYEVIKKIEVPVIKEIKVPYYVYVPVKKPYKYTVEPLIVKVPIEYFYTKSEEHGHVNIIPPHEDEHEEHEAHQEVQRSENYDHS